MKHLPKKLQEILPQNINIHYVEGFISDDVGIWHIFFKQNGKDLEVVVYDQDSFYAEWWLWKDGKDNFGTADNVENIIKLFEQ